MTAPEPDPAEQPEETRAVALSPANAMAAELWGSDDPRLMTRRMVAIADELKSVVEERNLYTQIGGRKHVNIEGWSLVGSMVGVFPHTESVEVMETGHIDEEIVTMRGRTGDYEKTLPAVDGILTFMATVTFSVTEQ